MFCGLLFLPHGTGSIRRLLAASSGAVVFVVFVIFVAFVIQMSLERTMSARIRFLVLAGAASAVVLGWSWPASAANDARKAPANLLAERAAHVEAIRRIAERIEGLHITSKTTVKDFVAQSDTIKTCLNAFLCGMKETDVSWKEDGTCEVTMEVKLQRRRHGPGRHLRPLLQGRGLQGRRFALAPQVRQKSSPNASQKAVTLSTLRLNPFAPNATARGPPEFAHW